MAIDSLTQRIRDAARCLGFFRTGVAKPGPLPWQEKFDTWLGQGMHGEMGYIERQAAKRSDPSLVLENVHSILVMPMNYYWGGAPGEGPLSGRISRYGWGEDYHRLLTGRMKALLTYIQSEEPSTRGLYYADTGPVMEKTWGAHSALGWLGKHSNLISRERGSWFFLGVMLLTCQLEYDLPEKDRCGTCTRCLMACPTGAIVAPYVVDARLCISYLTIELRGIIPRHLRAMMGNRIFGCDDCQDVCPWNRFAVPTSEPAFQPCETNPVPELTELASLTAGEFAARFRNRPILRAKRDGFVRNVVVALGNSHRPEAVPALTKALRDKSALVRGHAAWALGEIAAPEAMAALVAASEAEADPWVVDEMALALDK